MASPATELPQPSLRKDNTYSSEEDATVVEDPEEATKDTNEESSVDGRVLHERLMAETRRDPTERFGEPTRPSPSRTREEASRIDDDLVLMKAEKVATTSDAKTNETRTSAQIHRSRSRVPEPVDAFDAATNPLHEKAALFTPLAHPTTNIAKFFKYIHTSSFIVRYFTYITPVVLVLSIPLLIGALLPTGQNATVGGVHLLWFSIWLEILWLTLWAGRIAAKLIPYPLGLIASVFTNNSKKWRDLGKQLELPATFFFWWLGVEISFLPTMINHHADGNTTPKPWEVTVNKLIVSIFVGTCLNFFEKIVIQLIAISFHLRTYADRIELNKFQIGSLTKLYAFSKEKIAMEDSDFAEKPSGPASGARTPAMYADRAQEVVHKALAKVGDVAGVVAGDFTGKKIAKSGHPHQVVLTLLHSPTGSQVLARRLYRTFVREGFDTVFSGDLKSAFDNNDEADAAFTMFDKDMNGDISMEELEAVCVEIGRERKSITASLKDLDSVVAKLNDVLFFIVCVITLLVLISLLSTSASGVLTSAGSTVLALSWLFSATAQEFLQSVVFVFIKHPFDVGDRVSIYGNTGPTLKGDDYFVKEVSLLYTEFKKMEGHVVQAPNSYLNTLFILNMRRSGGLAEAIPLVIRFGTSLQQIDALRQQLLEFVRAEKREYQGNILTELRDVTEAYSLTLNVVFFYKSNWQNELLRLQRRNKFICALMIAMQDLGIEGPRCNQAGWQRDQPYFMQAPYGAPPIYSAQPHNHDTGAHPHPDPYNQQDPPVPSELSHPSILRQCAPSGASNPNRGRSESVSQMSKRVDFSLGMRDMPAGDQLSDIFEERPGQVVTDFIRQQNRADDERRTQADAIATGRSTSRDYPLRRLNSVASSGPETYGGIFRRSTTQSSQKYSRAHGDSVSSSQETHRNRFLNRFARSPGAGVGVSGRSMDLPRDSLAEEGHAPPMDPRSGTVSSQAGRMHSYEPEEDVGVPPPPVAPLAIAPPAVPLSHAESLSRDFETIRKAL